MIEPDKETFTDEEVEIFSEYVDEVWSDYKVTRNRDGSIFSTSQNVGMKMTVPKGGDFNSVFTFQRIQLTNLLNSTHENKRLKKVE